MAFYDDLTTMGQRFSPSPGNLFSGLGDAIDKFMDLDSLNTSFKAATGLAKQNETLQLTSGAQQAQNEGFMARYDSMMQESPQFHMSAGFGNDVTSRFSVQAPGGGYNALQNYMDMLGGQIAQQKMGSGLGQMPGVGMGSGLSSLSPTIDRWNADISAANARFGTPSNLIKALMNTESGGIHRNDSGQVLVNGAGAIGLMQVVGKYHQQAAASLGLDLYKEADNIAYGAYLLSQEKNRCGSWEGAVTAYYTGGCQATGARDNPLEGGSGMTDNEYVNKIITQWKQLDATGGSLPGTTPGQRGSLGAVNYSAFTGGNAFPITQELGPTEFAMGAGAGMYGYGGAYGVTGHPGIDVGTPRGTNLTSPWAGTVVCVGGAAYGSDTGGGGCGFYGDEGGGPGRIQIRLDNGDHLILGHTSAATVTPGQRVAAGQVVGRSGTANGDHVHVEYRKRTPGATSSGFTVVNIGEMSGGAALGGGIANPMQASGYSSGGTAWGGSGYNPAARQAVYFGR